VRLLLDSHVLLWALNDPGRLPPRVSVLLVDPALAVFVSVASLWELRIKAASGKLDLPPNLPDLIRASGFDLLPIELRHIDRLGGLASHHRDPFDRMLIAQALADDLTLVSADRMVTLYDAPVLWS